LILGAAAVAVTLAAAVLPALALAALIPGGWLFVNRCASIRRLPRARLGETRPRHQPHPA
jgi:hypothetical protein